MPGVRAHDAEAFLDAMIGADQSVLLGTLSPDVRWWVPPSATATGIPRPLAGADAVVALIGEPSNLFAPGSRVWTLHHVVADGDLAIVHANLAARTRSGADYSNEYALVLRFEEGRVAEVWEHVDTVHFQAQMTDGAGAPSAPADEALAHVQIQSLLARYYHAIDGMDWGALESEVLAEDAVWEVVQRTTTGVMEDRIESRASVLGWFRTMMEGAVTMSQGTCRHFIGTTAIDVAGSTARSTSHLQAADMVTLAPLANGVVTAEHVLTPRGWRIRRYRVDEHITATDMAALADTFGTSADDR